MKKSDAPSINLSPRKTTFTNEFSEEVYEDTYKYGADNDINDTHHRVAKDIASVEKEELHEYWTSRFLDILENFQFVPGGRITSNAGTGLRGTSYINCFVSGPTGPYQDSMEGILDELRRQALILKSEGGYGFCADFIRPRGSFIYAIANESPGAVKMLDMWDTQSDVITSGSGKKKTNQKSKNKIRKGAQMVTLSCWHPDIEEFITAKQTPGRLTKFNMSVLITDEFMAAVREHKPWSLRFPNYDVSPEVKKTYNETWNGDIGDWINRGLPIRSYKTYEDATELWDLIMKSTYNRNEPGVLFVDTINKWNNLYYNEYISATNPCGEQVLPKGGVCLLGSLNLTQFIDIKNNDWDYKKLEQVIPVAIRFMDNVNDRTTVPLETQRESLRQKRRLGLGVLGYGSALLMLKVKYGSKKALKLTEELMDFVMNQAYQASALLAAEKGSFLLYDKDKYLQGQFIQKLSTETKKLIEKHGIRNSHLLSIQPTGNSSVLANNVSGGLEPVFRPEYIRTVTQAAPPDDLTLPQNIDWARKTCESNANWEWITEGDEALLRTTFNNEVYKIDCNRGLSKETAVTDYGVLHLKESNEWDASAAWAASAGTLELDDHIKTMEVFSKYIDSAMSKTVNIPNDYSYDEFKDIYTRVHSTGTIKGCTTYRVGTMATVLADKNETKVSRGASKRLETLPCDIHHFSYHNEKWIALVGLLNKQPYEVFAFREKNVVLSPKIKSGKLTKRKVKNYSKYDLECEDGTIVKDIASHFETGEEETITRLISALLRHGGDIEVGIAQLLKSQGTIVSFNHIIARTLKKYLNGQLHVIKCPKCGSKNLQMREGCCLCLDCGDSRCA